MGVYTDTILTLRSSDKVFIEQLASAVSPRPKLPAVQQIINKLLRRKPAEVWDLMAYLLPMPEPLRKTVTNGYSGPSPAWRDWRMQHWGSPADVGLDLCERIGENELNMRFTSYNGILTTGITNAAKEQGFAFKLLYSCDQGGVGICTEHALVEYDFPGERPPAEAGVPEELIEAFDLNAVYGAYLEES